MFFYHDHLGHYGLSERTASDECQSDECQDDAIAPSPGISSKGQRPYPSYVQYSPRTLDHDGLEDLLLAPHIASADKKGSTSVTQSQPPPHPSESEPSTRDKKVSSGAAATAAAAVAPSKTVVRKRTNRKDRHSKIATAQGKRERRIRLSVDVARKFFELHDVLGLDKASKTVEWLLTKSAKAIKAVTTYSNKSTLHHGPCGGSGKLESSTSGCDVIKCSSYSARKNAVDGLEAVPAPETTRSTLASDPFAG